MKRKSVRRTLIVALALMVAVAMIPSMAFAQSGDGTERCIRDRHWELSSVRWFPRKPWLTYW